MERLLHDVRYALRQLRRSPGFAAAAILILGIGIGASTAVFSVVDNVLFRPLDLPDSDRLIALCEAHQGDRTYCSVSPPDALDWRDRARTIETLGVARARGMELKRGAGELTVGAAMATPGFLQALGVPPLHGRLLIEEDMLPHGAGNALVLSHALWRDEFGADPAVVGQTVIVSSGGDGRVLRDQPMVVVGVLPEGVTVPRLESARAWMPLQLDARSEEFRGWRGFIGLARLTDGATLAQAQAELDRLQTALAETYPDAVRNWTVHAMRLRDYITAGTRGLLLLFLGAVGIVLAIVCVNLTGLLLARAMQRERELTVCAALGASRGRLAARLLVEAGVLAALGGVVGVLLATWLVDAFVALAPAGVPRIDDIAVDGRILAFACAVTAATGLVFGFAPALRLRRVRLYDALQHVRSGTADRSGSLARRVLVVAQLAMALTLAVSAGLLLRSFGRQLAFDPGFEIGGLLTFQVYPPMWRYDSPARLADFYRRAEEAIEAIPGVTSAGTASAGPLIGGGDGRTPFLVHGRPPVPVQDAPTVQWYNAGPGYFPALGVAVVRGRNLAEDDRTAATPAALISESMARRHWPDASPIGARLTLPDWETDVEVVGVVPDLRLDHATPPEPAIYVSDRQRPRGASFFVVRTSGDAASIAPAVRQAFAELDPDVQPRAVSTMEQLLGAQLTGPRFNLLLIGLFAAIALALSASGIYAVIAYTVASRRREFGVRMALGARRMQVLRLVLADGGTLLAAGLLVGLVGAFFFTRLLRGLVQDIAATDPLALAGAVVVLAVTAAVATIAPAVSASRTEPAAVLRGD